MSNINVAVIGVGNCASSLIQGVHYYRNAREDELIPGIMHSNLGGYHINDINFVAAFDIDKNKVGKDLAEAIFSPPNNTFKFTDKLAYATKGNFQVNTDGFKPYKDAVIYNLGARAIDFSQIIKKYGFQHQIYQLVVIIVQEHQQEYLSLVVDLK